jgi:hypothetical protein
VGYNYRTFKGCNPPAFDGKGDAAATHQWISEIKAVIAISECRDDQVVKYTSHSFLSKALHWWVAVKQVKEDDVIQAMRWTDLKKLVLNKFCPQCEINRVEAEFLTIKAGNMTHQEYTSKYTSMVRRVPHLVNIKEMRISCTVQGLPPRVRTFVKASAPQMFDSAVELSRVIYDDVDSREAEKAKPKCD